MDFKMVMSFFLYANNIIAVFQISCDRENFLKQMQRWRKLMLE